MTHLAFATTFEFTSLPQVFEPALRRETHLLHGRRVFGKGDEAKATLCIEELHLSIIATWPVKEPPRVGRRIITRVQTTPFHTPLGSTRQLDLQS